MIFKNWSCERFFLCITLVVGTILMLITPPMCTPDEKCHFLNSYTIADGDLFPEVVDGKVGKYIDNDVINFCTNYDGTYNMQSDEKYSFYQSYMNSWLEHTNRDVSFYDNILMSKNPCSYIVSAAGIFVGKGILRLWGSGFDTPFNLLLFGRLANFIFYITVCYFAIKNTPFLKKTMAVLLLMPMSIYLGASISLDCVLIATCALFFSLIMRLFVTPDDYIITKMDIFQTIFCVFFIISVKQIMIPALLFLFLVPIKKFPSKRKYFICIACVILLGICLYLVPTHIINGRIAGVPSETADLITQQEAYIDGHLFSFPKIVLNSFRSNRLFYLSSFYGNLGLLDLNFMVPMVALFYLAYFWIIVVEVSQTEKIKVPHRIVGIAVTVICIFGMFYNMYHGWTPLVLGVGTDTVSGVQGRYFIPVFLFALVLFMNGLLRKPRRISQNVMDQINQILNLIFEIIVLSGAVMTVVYVFAKYWV